MTATSTSEPVKGWTFPVGSTKAHCFLDADAPSLCGKWSIFHPDPSRFEDDRDDHSNNCMACRKRLAKLRAAGGATGEEA